MDRTSSSRTADFRTSSKACCGDPPPTDPFARVVVESLRPLLTANLLIDHVMPWFAQARDAADGRLFLNNGKLDLAWDIAKSRQTVDAVVHVHQRLAQLTQGMALT